MVLITLFTISIGGVVSSKSKPTSDITSEGFLDGLTFIPGVPVIQSVVHGVQTAWRFLDTWVNNPSQPPAPVPSTQSGATTGSNGGGILSGGLAGILPFLGGLFGGTRSDQSAVPDPAAVPLPATDPSTTGNPPSKPVIVKKPAPVQAKGGILSWLPHLWAETDNQGNFIEESSKHEGASGIISRDGRVARITRAQQDRQTDMHKKKRVWTDRTPHK